MARQFKWICDAPLSTEQLPSLEIVLSDSETFRKCRSRILYTDLAGRLFIFDMDGTLMVKTTASIEIAKITGTIDQLHLLEKSFRWCDRCLSFRAGNFHILGHPRRRHCQAGI